MSIAHIVGYEKMSGKRYGDPPLPNWAYEQSLAYPHHDRHSELIQDYKTAKKQHDESVEILQFAYQRQWENPENTQRSESVKECQQHVEVTEKVLKQATQALREFNNHTPKQRISLYQAEIEEWETQLIQARRAQQEHTEAMLNDPDAARKRLERMVNGYSGEKAEYSPEQLSQLRSLKNDVESIEAKILSLQRDVERIRQLAAEQESKLQIQAIMDAAIPRFNEACVKFSKAWEELRSLADEHGIRVVSPHNLQIPTGAKFKQSNSPHEGHSTIHVS